MVFGIDVGRARR